MKMHFCASTLFLISYFIWGTSAQYEGASCLTPNQEKAFCTSLPNCPILTEALSARNEMQKKFLKHSICGYQTPNWGSIPLVCCGSNSNYKQSSNQGYGKNSVIEDPIPTTTTTTTEAPTTTITLTGIKYLEKMLPSRGVCGLNEDSNRILGGTEANIGEFPWMAQLLYRDKTGTKIEFYNLCGGSLISKNYVITAAHCIVGEIEKYYGKIYGVRLGEHDIKSKIDCYEDQGCNEEVVDVPVVEVIAHEGYLARGNAKNHHHDIGLLRLAQNVVFTEFITPICLPLNGETVIENQMVFTAGWGIQGDKTVSDVKMKLNITVSDQLKCRDIYQKKSITLLTSQLCVGGETDRDSCSGDSGGPLMTLIPHSYLWYLEGIVSFGPTRCGTTGTPGIYTKVSSYLDWIAEKIRP